ncbi:MAG: hypothetical protein AB1717_08025 [Pseudomonadota bacterium]
MKRKLIIHVGMGKTGSTSIQRTLREGSHYLEEHGIKYLGLMLEQQPLSHAYAWHVDGGWPAFHGITDRDEATQQMVGAFVELDESLAPSIHTLIWSNESLFDSFSVVAAVLDIIATRFDIQVVGYIRSPDSWVLSAYMQWGIKHKSYVGALKSFKEWTNGRPYLVMPMLNQWLQFDPGAAFYNFNSVSDVVRHFIDNHLPESARGVPVKRSNDTPPPVAQALFASYNSLSAADVLPTELMPLIRAAGLHKTMQPMSEYNELLPSEDDIAEYLSHNKNEVEAINRYFEATGQRGFDLLNPRYKDYSVTQQDVNRALLKLVVYLWREVNSLKASRTDQ